MMAVSWALLTMLLTSPPATLAQVDPPAGGYPPVASIELFGGNIIPLGLTLKELTGDWRRFTIGNAGSMDALVTMMANEGKMPMLAPVYYTQGRTVTVGTEAFLVAYRREAQPLDPRAVLHRDDDDARARLRPDPVTPDTMLRLSLLNLRQLGDILEIKPFNLGNELVAGNAQGDAVERARMKALQSQSASNLRQLMKAVWRHAEKHHGELPPLHDLAKLAADAGLPETVVTHPLTGDPYQVNAALGGQWVTRLIPNEELVLYEATPWPDGRRHIALLDGVVWLVTEEQWAQRKARAGIRQDD